MAPSQFILNILALCSLAAIATAQIPSVWKPSDAVTYFCQRWFHQSLYYNEVLYIHGGVQTFNVPEHATNWTNNTLGYNDFLLQVDMKQSWDWKTNITYIASEEHANPITGTSVRSGGILGTMFQGPANDSNIYTYGGTTFRGNESFPNPDANYYSVEYSDQYPLWSFDNGTQIWNQYDIAQSWTPSYGAATEAPDQGLAFYLNGRTDNGTSSSTLHDGDVQTLLDGMIIIDMVQHTSRNVSTSGMYNNQTRVGGAMEYVPGVGDNGVIIAFGGQVYDGKRITTSKDKGRLLDFKTIEVFDIESYLKDPAENGTWYSQSTSGDIPPARIDFCTIIASAPDNSSHNIYLYAGRDHTNTNETIYYDDIYVLSLPSFTWIKVFTGKSPRFGHTCHLVGGRQMLTVGGHNKNPNSCDWEKKARYPRYMPCSTYARRGVALVDLPTMGWGSVYHAGHNPYQLSDALVTKLGGSPTGNATVRTPLNGWSTSQLGEIMSKTRIYSNDPIGAHSTDSEDSGVDSKTRIATIAAGIVAGVVLLACTSWIMYMYRRRNRNVDDSLNSGCDSPVAEIEGKSRFELSQDEKNIYEISTSECRHEMPNNQALVEADAGNCVTYAVELPTTNFHHDGRWGVPTIRVPSPTHLRRTGMGFDGG